MQFQKALGLCALALAALHGAKLHAALNVAPNPSFELDLKRNGGWLPIGVITSNSASGLFLTNTVHRHGARSLGVVPGPAGLVTGKKYVASYNGGEDELTASAAHGVRGARTIALRLDPDIREVHASAWVQASPPMKLRLSLVWTGRYARRPAEVLHQDTVSQPAGHEPEWTRYEITATRPIRSHQVQLWVESDGASPFYLDDVDITLRRAPGVEVLVDQLGYETRSTTKVALLQSATPLDALPVARVIDLETFREVIRTAWQPCGERVEWERFYWTVDFSALTNHGRYVVAAAEGKGAVFSPPFAIGDDLFRQQTAEPGYRFFYYQRCGIALPGFHAACHQDDSRMPDGHHRDVAGGWHDAGDYNKYCGFTPESVYALAVAYHRRPQLFNQWDRDHNGRADLLDEALWGAAFLRKALDLDTLDLVGTISTGYRYWDAPEKETDNQSGTQDDRPVTQRGGDRTWCAPALALIAAQLKRPDDKQQAKEFLDLALRLYQNVGGGMEAWAALHAATGDSQYQLAAQHRVTDILQATNAASRFRELGEFAVAFPADPLVSRIRAVAEKRAAELEAQCGGPFAQSRSADGAAAPYFSAYTDVNDWYVGDMMRRLEVSIEAAMVAQLGASAGRRVAENQVHWILGRNPLGVSMMEGVGTRFVPNYHHRYNAIPGNPRGAVPGALLNGFIRPWPHQDRPWLDMTPEPNADYHCNEPWLPYNNRWLLLLSVW